MQFYNKDSNGSYNDSWQMSEEDDTTNYSCRKKDIINNRYNVINDYINNINCKKDQLIKSNEDYILSYDESNITKKDNIYSKNHSQDIFSLYKQSSQYINENPSYYENENKVSEFKIDNNHNNTLLISSNNLINNNYSFPNYKNNELSNEEYINISNNNTPIQHQHNFNINKNTLIQLQNETTNPNNEHHEHSSNKYNINSCISNSNQKVYDRNSSVSSFIQFKKQIISRNQNNSSLNNNNNFYLSSFPSSTNNIISQIHKTPHKQKYLNKSQHNNFIPSLNENSLRIAANLPSFEERLISDIKKRKSKHRKNYSLSSLHSRNKNIIHYDKLSHKINDNNKLYLSLYERGLQMINKKKEEQHKHKLQKENSFRKYPYKPILNKNSTKYHLHSRNKSDSAFHVKQNTNITSRYNKDDIYIRSKRWIQNIQNKISKSKIKETNKIMTNCTFKPHINKKCEGQILTMRDIKKCYNDKYYNNNINCNQYVKRRLKCIANKENDIKIYNKRFPNGSNYQMKSTFPKEFVLCSYNKKYNHFNNKDVSTKRKELGISSFFDDVLSIEESL